MKELTEIKISKEITDRLKIEFLHQKELKEKLKLVEGNILTIITTILYQNDEKDYTKWELSNDLTKLKRKDKTAQELREELCVD